MNAASNNQEESIERRCAPRQRTFLTGIVYCDQRKSSVNCIIRELSDTGARIAFNSAVAVPDDIELQIPQKLCTPARVMWRKQFEIGVAFGKQHPDEPHDTNSENLARRVDKIENELIAMKRLLKKLEAKALPGDTEL